MRAISNLMRSAIVLAALMVPTTAFAQNSVFTVADDATLQLDGASSLTTANVDGTDYLFTTSVIDNGVSVFSIASNGALTNVFNVTDDATLNLGAAQSVVAIEISGTDYIYVAGTGDDGISSFSVASNGALTNVENYSGGMDGPIRMSTAVIGGNPFLFVPEYSNNRIGVHAIANDGTLSQADVVSDGGSYRLGGAAGTAVAVVDGTTFLMVAGQTDGGISAFSVASDGTLTSTANVSGAELDGIRAITTTEIDGTTYVIGAGWQDDGLTIYSLSSAGALSLVGSTQDNATLNLNGPYGVTALQFSGVTYLMVGAQADKGFSLFTMSAAGGLTNIANVADTDALELNYVSFVDSAVIDGNPYFFVASDRDDGIGVFDLDLTAPLVASIDRQTPSTSPTSADSVTWRVTFNEQVTNVDAADFTRTGTTGTLSVSSATSTAWDVTLSGGDMASLNATVTLGFAGGQNITDLVGNTLSNTTPTGTNTNTFVLSNDITAPRIASIVRNNPTSSTTAADVLVWRVTFDEAVQNVTTGDFTITGTTATIFDVTNNSATESDVVVRGGDLNDLNATVTLGIAGGQDITDLAGNALSNTTPTGTTQLTYLVDNTPPVFTAISRNAPATSPTNADTLVFDLTFSESVAGVGAEDFTITGTTATGVLGGSGSSYTLTLSGGDLDNLDGTVSIAMVASPFIFDLAGNLMVGSTPTVTNVNSYVVQNSSPPVFSLVFSPDTINDGQVTTATYTINSTANPVSATGLDFTHNLPAGIHVAGANASTTCTGGTLPNVVGSSAVTYSGGSVGAGATCTVSMDIVSIAPGTYATTTGDLTSSLGNGGTASDTLTVLDITAPRIASIARQSPTSSATNGSSVTWRVTFDEAVQNVTADDFTRTGTTGTLAVNNVSATVTDVTVSGGDMASVNDTVELGFAGGQDIADTAGNALSNTTPTGTNDNTFLVDHAPPSVVISGPSGPVSGAFSVTLTFSEPMTGVAVGNISVGNGAASNLQQSDSVTYSATITPAGEGSVTVNFAAGAATDTAGNDNLAASQFSVTADTTAPRLSHFSGIQTYTHLDTISFRATFNEDVANVSATDFSVSGTTATVTNVAANVDGSYTLTVSGGDLADIANTTVSLAIAGGHDIADVAGNLLTNTTATGSSDSIYVNNTPPVGTFTSTATSPVSGDFTVSLNFTPQEGFADNILALEQSDIVISNATIESFTLVTGSGGVTTGANIVVRPTGSGTVTLDLPANSVFDEAENQNPAATQFSVTSDLTPPRLSAITRASPTGERTNSDTLSWIVTFSEPVENVGAADFALTGSTAGLTVAIAAAGDQPDVSGIVPAAAPLPRSVSWQVTASGGDLASVNAAVSLALAASPTINDEAGNALTDTSATGTVETFDVNNLAPLIATIERDTPATSATNEDSLTWRFTFAQIDNSFSLPANAFTVSGTTGTVTRVSRFSTGFDVTVSGGDLASLDGDVTIGLANTDFADDYGNVMDRTIPGGAELTYTVDNTAPSGHAVAINPSPINAANQTAIGVDFTGFEAGGSLTYTVTSSGGAGSLSGGFAVPVADGSFPPQDTSVIPDGTTTLTVIHTDAVGNAAPAVTVTALKDTVVPTLAITGPSGSVSGAFTATFTFSEDIQNFDLSDITVGNGTASNLQSVSASGDDMSGPAVVAAMRVFAATITPASDGAVTVDVAGSAAQDDAGNANTAATQFSVTNDATAPVATNVEFVTTGGTPTASDTLMWAVTFSEDVTNVSANDFALTGTTGTVTTVDTPQPNVVVVTASGGDLANLDGQVTLTLAGGSDLSDAAGNTPADLTVQSGGTDQRTVYLDNTAPTLTSVVHHRPLTSPTDSDTLTWRVSFSEFVNGVDAGDFTISGTTATLSVSTPSAGPDVPAAATTAQSTNNTFDVTASGGNLANLNGEVTLTLVTTGGIADNSGNGFTNASPTGTDERTWSVLNDAVAPRVASIARLNPVGGNTSADSLTWRVTFSEPVGNIDTSDFAVTGSTAQAVQVSPIALGMPPQVTGDGSGQIFAISQSTYDVTISGGDLSTLTAVVSLGFAPTQDISDDAGNALVDTGPTGTNQAYFVDNESPTATISTTASSPISGPFQVTILFSENVAGFEGADLSVTNATLSDISASSASVYTATVKPGTGASVTLQMTANGVEDAAGNPNAASEVFSIVHDTNRTLTVSLPGVGEGTVTSLPAGIDCGTDCSEEIAVGTSVTLTATAASGSSFAGWTDGPCTGSGNTACAFVMSVDQAVAARFTLDTPPAGRIVAATLPGARSGHVGGPVVTAFLSVVSRTTSPAQSCTIAAPAGAPVTLSYSRLDGAGEVTGPVDPVFDIAAGDALSFVIAMTPVSETPA
ncbi:MAG TPA: hypothetical protein DCQ53_06785, partial [Alphaproteobacteria bacterium]|nr:hypothetical protein [Alphaproteobacteria bacterium]